MSKNNMIITKGKMMQKYICSYVWLAKIKEFKIFLVKKKGEMISI